MQIKKRLQINVAVSVLTALVICLTLFLSLHRVNKTNNMTKIAGEIIANVLERVTLRNDYMRNNSARAKEQWFAKHEQISGLLKLASENFQNAEDRKNIDEIIRNHESIGRIFSAIVANREKSGFNPESASLSREVDDRLLNQLNMRVYEVTTHCRQLLESSRAARASALRVAWWSIAWVLAIVIMVAVISSWTMNRTIADRVRRLRDSASVIGGGNFDHLIDIKGDDEFGEIAKSYNAMTAKLRGSYHDLEKEIDERKRAEEALHKAHDELEIRIQERTRELKEANESLEQRVSERTVELQTVNASLFDSRRAALNMMEDAVAARRQAEELSVELQREATEHKRAKEELRLAHDELERRVMERTEELAGTLEALLEEMAVRERAEKSLQRLKQLYEVLSETNQTIVRSTDRDSMFSEFCRIAVEHGGFLLSWVGLLDNESQQVRIVASSGATAYLEDILITTEDKATGEGPTGISIRKGTYYICNDFQNDPCTRPWHEKGRIYGIHASASIAIKKEGEVIGALTLYAGEKDFFDRQHVELLVQMGEDVSFALDNLAREAQRRKAEESLHEEILGRLRVVEELREKEQLLLQQSRQAAMGEMIGNIAHQWRQPLNVLGMVVQQMQLFYDMGSFSKEYLDTSVNKSMGLIRHMSQTIDDFRNFFQPDKEKVEFTIHEVVAKTVSLVEDGFKSEQIGIDLHANANPSIIGFPNEYSQVLLNILMNAKDVLLERRTDGARINITICKEEGMAVVTIADNAGGVPDKVIHKIFEPYFTTKGPDRGTGVGLFMSKNIIEKNMNGRLTVRNTVEGAEFRIEV